MIAAPRADASVPRYSALRGLARLVTETPWALTGDDLHRARRDGLGDHEVLHAIALSALFGYLNRVADAVGIELDYQVAHAPPPPEPDTPPLPAPPRDQWPAPVDGPLRIGDRPGLSGLIDTWREHALERAAPLSVRQRHRIAAHVGALTGDARAAAADATPADDLDRALLVYAETIALAPWRLGAAALAPLRDHGLDDDALFDVIATASFATFQSRLAAALSGLAR